MEKVKIGAVTYTVADAPIPDCGLIDYEAQTIVIKKGLGKDARAVTMWHEVIHGILYNMGHVNHDEIIVDGIAHGVVQCLRDNPQLKGR